MTDPAEVPASRVMLLIAVLLIALNLRPTITGIGPLLAQISEDLGTTEAALGALAAVPLIAFAVVSPLAHGISARFGMSRTVLWSLVLLGDRHGVAFSSGLRREPVARHGAHRRVDRDRQRADAGGDQARLRRPDRRR